MIEANKEKASRKQGKSKMETPVTESFNETDKLFLYKSRIKFKKFD